MFCRMRPTMSRLDTASANGRQAVCITGQANQKDGVDRDEVSKPLAPRVHANWLTARACAAWGCGRPSLLPPQLSWAMPGGLRPRRPQNHVVRGCVVVRAFRFGLLRGAALDRDAFVTLSWRAGRPGSAGYDRHRNHSSHRSRAILWPAPPVRLTAPQKSFGLR